MPRLILTLVLALTVTALAASAGGASPSLAVSTLTVTAWGGAPPDNSSIGVVSTSSGVLQSVANERVGTWAYRCAYLGGQGRGSEDSHFCTFVHKIDGKGSITAKGGIGYNSLTVRWWAITGATGTYRGVIGTVRVTNFAQNGTTLKFHLIR